MALSSCSVEVVEPLNEISEAIGLLAVLIPERKEIADAKGPGSELTDIVRKERAAKDTIGAFYSTVSARVKPYLKLHQKSPARWWG